MRSAGHRVAANMFGALTALATGPILAHALGVQGRGELAAVVTPLILATIFINVGSGEIMSADIASGRLSPRDAFGPSLAISTTIAVFACLLLVLAGPHILREYPSEQLLLQYLAFTLPLIAVVGTIRALRQGERKHARVSLETWLASALRILGFGTLAIIGSLDVTSASCVVVACLVAPACVLGFRLPLWSGPNLHNFMRIVRLQISKSVRSMPGTTASQLNLRLDQAVLVSIVGPTQLGLYAVAVSLAEMPVVITSALRQVLLTESAARDSANLMAQASRCTILLMLPFAAVLPFIAPQFLGFLFGAHFAGASGMTSILVFATLLGAPSGFLTTGLVAFGQPGRASIPAVIGLIVTACALPVLAVAFGGSGAAWASLASYTTTSVVAVLLFAKTTGVPYRRCVVATAEDVALLWLAVKRAGSAANPRK